MIVLLEYPGTTGDTPNSNSFLFRGKNSGYWEKKVFAHEDVHCLEYPDPGKGTAVDFLVLFNPGTFLEIEPEGVDEIITRLKHVFKEGKNSTEESLFTLGGKPFLAMPVKTFERLKPALDFSNPFTCTGDFENVEVINLHLESAYKTLGLNKDFRQIERFILNFQAVELTANGVFLEDYFQFYIEGLPPIGEGTRISTGVVIKGDSKIGKNVVLYPHVYIENSIIGDNCVVLPGCIVRDSTLEKNVQIGPYTHLRNGALVKEGAKMGNFVEMKKSVLGHGSKAMHLTYIGDAQVGENVNIGAGTITCNYDGVNKNKTIIEDNAFIGSGTELVAPVKVRKNSYVAAGSTITEEVPENSLAVARGRQRNLLDWVKRKRKQDRKKLKKCDT